MLTVRELRAVVTDVERSTADSVTLTLRPTRQWRGFQAGQFVQLTVDIDGVRRTRCYSPACSQYRADGRIELTVKAHPEGLVSQYLHAHARPGLVVGLAQADGVFTLPSPRPDKVLLISGGSGITPVLSMLRTLVRRGLPRRGRVPALRVHRGTTSPTATSCARWPPSTTTSGSSSPTPSKTEGGDLHGLFDETHLAEAAPWYAEAQTFLCGPPGLMTAVRAHYAARKGIEDAAAHRGVRAAAGRRRSTASRPARCASARPPSQNTGATLLEQAEAAGLTPEHGCRMGICFTCTQVKTSGCTRNIRTGELNSDPDTEVQLCINRRRRRRRHRPLTRRRSP